MLACFDSGLKKESSSRITAIAAITRAPPLLRCTYIQAPRPPFLYPMPIPGPGPFPAEYPLPCPELAGGKPSQMIWRETCAGKILLTLIWKSHLPPKINRACPKRKPPVSVGGGAAVETMRPPWNANQREISTLLSFFPFPSFCLDKRLAQTPRQRIIKLENEDARCVVWRPAAELPQRLRLASQLPVFMIVSMKEISRIDLYR